VYVTTQNKARLGDTVPELLKYLPSDSGTAGGNTLLANVDKTAFSMYNAEILSRLQQTQNSQSENNKIDAIITGIETHICVTQTTLDLLSAGHRVYVIADGVSSVNAEERVVALNRLRDAGAIVTTSESVIFEVLRDAGGSAFKGVNALVKESKEDTREALRMLCKY
jgi:Isochorismatase family